MAQPSCGSNHSWVFTGKQQTKDPYPNYYYRCSNCGKTGWTEQSGGRIRAYGE